MGKGGKAAWHPSRSAAGAERPGEKTMPPRRPKPANYFRSANYGFVLRRPVFSEPRTSSW